MPLAGSIMWPFVKRVFMDSGGGIVRFPDEGKDMDEERVGEVERGALPERSEFRSETGDQAGLASLHEDTQGPCDVEAQTRGDTNTPAIIDEQERRVQLSSEGDGVAFTCVEQRGSGQWQRRRCRMNREPCARTRRGENSRNFRVEPSPCERFLPDGLGHMNAAVE